MAFDPNDDGDKKIVQEMIDIALEEATKALKNKNTELITELREAKKGKQIDPSEVAKLEDQIENLQAQLSDANKAAKEAIKQVEKTTKTLETERGITKTLLVDNGLTEALVKAKVAPQFLPAVKAMLQSQIEMKDENGIRKAVVGDKDLETFVTSWAQSDDGKHYVAAPNNSGVGAKPGDKGNSGEQNKTMSRLDFEALNASNPAAAGKFFKEGGTLVDTAA